MYNKPQNGLQYSLRQKTLFCRRGVFSLHEKGERINHGDEVATDTIYDLCLEISINIICGEEP